MDEWRGLYHDLPNKLLKIKVRLRLCMLKSLFCLFNVNFISFFNIKKMFHILFFLNFNIKFFFSILIFFSLFSKSCNI